MALGLPFCNFGEDGRKGGQNGRAYHIIGGVDVVGEVGQIGEMRGVIPPFAETAVFILPVVAIFKPL